MSTLVGFKLFSGSVSFDKMVIKTGVACGVIA